MLPCRCLGKIAVAGMTIFEIRDLLQAKVDSLFRHAYVEVRLLSFKFTVIGEVRAPGSYVNYNDQLTVLEGYRPCRRSYGDRRQGESACHQAYRQYDNHIPD